MALPGGIGTLAELTEVLCMNQIGTASKPVGLLNVDGYFDGFLLQLRRAVEDRLLPREELERIQVSDDPETLLSLLDALATA